MSRGIFCCGALKNPPAMWEILVRFLADDAYTGRLLVGVPEVLMGGCAQRPRVQAAQLKGPRPDEGRGFTFDGGLVISYLFPYSWQLRE